MFDQFSGDLLHTTNPQNNRPHIILARPGIVGGAPAAQAGRPGLRRQGYSNSSVGAVVEATVKAPA
jgi:hypothetical protein